MSQETINAIKEALTPIAEKIGQGAGFSWEVVLQQQFIKGMWFGIAAVVIFLITLALAFGSYVESKDDSEASAGFGLAAFATLLISMILAFHFFSRLYNPEYYAIQFFINLIR